MPRSTTTHSTALTSYDFIRGFRRIRTNQSHSTRLYWCPTTARSYNSGSIFLPDWPAYFPKQKCTPICYLSTFLPSCAPSNSAHNSPSCGTIIAGCPVRSRQSTHKWGKGIHVQIWQGHDGADNQITLLLWVLVWWAHMYQVCDVRHAWQSASNALSQCKHAITEQLLEIIPYLLWNSLLPEPFTHATETLTSLSTYCHPESWLCGRHINQMSTLLQEHLLICGFHNVRILLSDFFEVAVCLYKLKWDVFAEARNTPSFKLPCPLEKIFVEFEKRGVHCLGFLVNVCVMPDHSTCLPEVDQLGNHWIPVVVDLVIK